MAWCWQTPRAFSWAKIYTIIWCHQARMSQYTAIQFFYALRQCYVSHHSKILFCKFIVPDLEANFMVTGFTTRDKKYIAVPILANL